MFVEALIKLLVSEHAKQPISGNVLSLGKQSITVPLPKIKNIFQDYDCKINTNFKEQYDNTTRARSGGLDDESFFSLFGNINYRTLDVSNYENASIIHNLNFPIPKELEGQFDFIIDGGTFDHLFDIKTCFENVTKLLKPGGRILQWNAASNFANAAYISFSADFFYDYYALNSFADCRTFFAISHSMGAQNWLFYEFIPPKNNEQYDHFKPNSWYMMTIVIAKKDINSSYQNIPVQLNYRDADKQNEYIKNSAKFKSNIIGPIKLKTISEKLLPTDCISDLNNEQKPCSKSYHKIGWL